MFLAKKMMNGDDAPINNVVGSVNDDGDNELAFSVDGGDDFTLVFDDEAGEFVSRMVGDTVNLDQDDDPIEESLDAED